MHSQRQTYPGLPGKIDDLVSLVGQLQDLHRDVLVLHTEQLKAGVGGLACLGIPVHLNCHVVSLWVPVYPHLCSNTQNNMGKVGYQANTPAGEGGGGQGQRYQAG